jgi:YD repeat-containing protein
MFTPTWGNVTSRTFSGTTGALYYNNLNELVEWNAGSNNQEWYVYDASGNRVLRRSTNSNGTTMTVYPFELEEHLYSGTGTNQSNTSYYFLAGHLIGSLDANSTYFYLTDALRHELVGWGILHQGNQDVEAEKKA